MRRKLILFISLFMYYLEFVTRSLCYFPTTNKAFVNNVVDTGSRHQEDSKLFLLDHYEEQDNSVRNCQVSAKCYRLNTTTCLGIKLPYTSTSFSLVPGVKSHEQVQEKLQQWKGLIHIPKCWAAIQPFLCSLYMPKCENNLVDLPSMEMCEMIQSPCRILHVRKLWPSEFKCNSSLLHYNCKNEVRELKFNSTGQCKEPLVHTDQESWYYNGIEGCGVQCHDPLFTIDERQEIRSIVIWGSSIAFVCNLFTVLTFAIDWNSSSKYPVHAIFYINMSFLMVSIGFLYQFRPGAGDYTVCHKDGTLRTSEPSIRENLSCVTSFVFTYYFLIAGIVWFVIFAYGWQHSSQAVGKIKERMDRKGPYYHLVAWSLPLVLTITIMALGEVDGDSLTGVCFVGVINKQMRAIFLLIPLAASFIGLFFFTRGLVSLIRLKLSSKDVISDHANAYIRENIVRVTVFSVLSLLFAIVTFVCHIYDFLHHVSWKESFRDFLVCQLRVGKDMDVEKCIMHSRPSVLMVQLQLLALFSTHVNVSTWVWSSATVNKWSRFIVSKVMNKEIDEPVMLKRHKLIARAFAKRKLLNTDGRLSISICNTRQDPIGLHFELNSQASNDISTTWAKALPKLITRRNALIVAPGSNSSQRRNSVDSEISYSVRRVSVESRRHSLDSTVSVQAVEVTKTVRKRPHRKKSRSQKFSKHKRRWSSKQSKYERDSEGSISHDSNLETEIMSALKIGSINIQQTIPNMKRRSAISGNEKDSLLVLHGKLFENNRCSSSTSDSYDNTTPMIQQHKDIELGMIQNNDSNDTDDDDDESEDIDDDDDSYALSSLLFNTKY